MKECLKEFFAVTRNSVYQAVVYGEENCPFIKKISVVGGIIGLPVGKVLGADGTLLAVADNLQFYYPEGHSMLSPQTSEERRLERVNTMWWRAGTSLIVALFLDKDEASFCSEQPDLQPCDQRWIEKTKEVLEAIGEEHPNVTICHWRELALLPAI
jgi:hypothetical protein